MSTQDETFTIKCPRCGLEGNFSEFEEAISMPIFWLLLFLLFPIAIIYDIWAGNKVKCPRCGKIF